MATEPQSPTHRDAERMPTGVPGLDLILEGGLLQGGIYILQGPPGAGKTILGNQICFDHVGRGGQALYVTLLAENHDRMLGHMSGLRFFHPETIARSLNYISAFRVLEQDGLAGLLTLIRREVQAREATLLVLDGLVAAEHTAATELEFKKFVHELQTQAGFTNCTMLLLTSARDAAVSPEHTMVDGLIELADRSHGWRAERDLLVRKFRGGNALRGHHAFRITAEGIVVYPRTEARLAVPSTADTEIVEGLPSGVPGLDAMIGGGIGRASTTLLMGPTGVGKTAVGLQFLTATAPREAALHFGFFETPPRLLAKADRLGLPLRAMIEGGRIEVVWQPPTEGLIDALAEALLAAVARRRVRRLVIDGLAGFQRLAGDGGRISAFFTALLNELRAQGVTTVMTIEVPDLVGPIVRAPLVEISGIAENLILLRYVELKARLHRLVSVLKIRDAEFDPSLREFTIGRTGVAIGDSFERVEAMLSGFAHEIANPEDDAPSPPRRKR